MKKIYLLFLLAFLPIFAYGQVEIDGIYYNLNSEAKTADVTSNPNKYSGDIVIPESVTYEEITYSVTSIGNSAFKGCSGLTSVTIPNSVTSIGNYAFNRCSGLTSVTIPSSMTSIDFMVFEGCSGLTSVTIPNSVTSIGERAFFGCSSLTSVTIPNSVTFIGELAFGNCISMISVTIPNSVTSIGKSAFEHCSCLTSVTIPNSMTSIGDNVFYHCSGLTSVTIPNSVTSIGEGAFKGCSSLTSVTIPNNVTSIGSSAFNGCSGLTSVIILGNVTSIASRTFQDCSSLSDITIPNKVTSIGDYAFSNCSSLTSIVIPDGVVSIGAGEFYNCTGLTSISIPKSVKYIGDEAFYLCKALSSVYISDIASWCNISFYNGTSNPLVYAARFFLNDEEIIDLKIPDGVTLISDYAFRNTRIISLFIPNTVTSIGKGSFAGCNDLNKVILSDNLTTIGESAFYECKKLKNVVIPNSVNSIGSSAFCSCSSLKEIRIPEGVSVINVDLAEYCSSLKSILIPSTVSAIKDHAFYGNSSLESVIVKMKDPVAIDKTVFTHKEGWLNVYVPSSATLYVPIGSEASYREANYWKDFKDIVGVVPDEDLFPDCPAGEVRDAAIYLYRKGIVEGDKEGKLNADREATRAEVAKTSFFGAYFGPKNVPAELAVDNYPSVYSDLQDKSTYYYRPAKALLYLEYGDGVTPFDRNRLAFEPEDNMERTYVLKELMETFNIKPESDYISKAASLGIITSSDNFRPYDNCTRGEAFLMLARIMQKIEAGEIDDPNPQESDYFEPLNTTQKTISLGASLQMGNFQHYTKTSFALNGVVPLAFAHTYNSYNTTLPSVFFGDKSKTEEDDSYLPLGDGWSHNYHSFITVVGDYQNNAADNGLRVIVHWGGGSIDVYKSDGTRLVPESMGIYDEMEYAGGDELTIKSKSQMEYLFSKQGSSGAAVFYLSSVKDRNGNTLTINYEDGQNGSKRISNVTDGNRSLKFSYLSGTDLLSEVNDPLSRSIKFDYFDNSQTGKKQLKSFTDAEGNTTTYEYADLSNAGSSKLLSRIQLPKGNYIENEYDANRRLKNSVSGVDGVPTTKTSVNVQTNYGSGSISTKSQVEVERGSQTSSYQYTYNENNVVTGMTGAKDMFVNGTYGNADHPELPTAMQSNSIDVSNVSYDEKGNVTSISVSGDGTLTTTMTYDEMNNLTSRTDPMGNKTTYSYDGNGNLTEVSAPEGVTASITVNSKGLPTETSNAMGVKTQYDYNEYGNLIKTTLPALGLSSSAVYDAASRLTSATDALGRTSSFVYNNNDLLTSETDALSHITKYAYDKNGNLTSITNAKGGVTTMSYDNATDWLLSVEFAGAKKQYDYNKDGTLSTFTKPDGTMLSYSYDELGRITSDGINSYSYDNKLRLSEISDGSKSVSFTYDGFNRISGTSYDGTNNSYSYDENGNCTSVNDTQYSYDGLDRLTSVSFSGGTINYTYRKDSKLEKVEYPNGMTTTYGYDEVGRLTSKQTTLANGTVVAGYSYILDKVGNITEQTTKEPYSDIVLQDEDISYSYNEGNRITKAGDISFEFDANGNTTKRGDESYSWDEKDHLTSAGSTSITYDPLGLIASYGDITFTTDPLGMGNVLSDSKSGAEYIYGNGLEARVINGKASYYVTDVRGSIVAIVDEDGNITHKYQYDDFGKVVQKEEADYNPFQYVGKYGVMVLNDHQYYMRARHYDPTIGRFLSEDPIWSTNLYPYADNNPVMGIDPRGLYKSYDYTQVSLLYDEMIDKRNQISSLLSEYQRRNLRFTKDASDSDRKIMEELKDEYTELENQYNLLTSKIVNETPEINFNNSLQNNKQSKAVVKTQNPSNNPYGNYTQSEQEKKSNSRLNIQEAIKNQSDYTEMGYGEMGSARGLSINPENWLDIIEYSWDHRSEWSIFE